jgi:hypothetical protein
LFERFDCQERFLFHYKLTNLQRELMQSIMGEWFYLNSEMPFLRDTHYLLRIFHSISTSPHWIFSLLHWEILRMSLLSHSILMRTLRLLSLTRASGFVKISDTL